MRTSQYLNVSILDFIAAKTGWLVVFNGTFSTNRLYYATSIQQINPVTYPL